MTDYAILRQSHTAVDTFADIETMLSANSLWSRDASIPHWTLASNLTDARKAFSRASGFLAERIEKPQQLTVIVDEVDPFALDPLTGGGWSSLIGMLILAYPEIQWTFALVSGGQEPGSDKSKPEKWQEFAAAHRIESLFENRGSPLFDGYGLREWVISQIDHRLSPTDRSCQRSKLAVVLEDECAYSHFEAYMAYSRGFRVHAIASWEEAVRLLGPKGRLDRADCGFLVSLEDWSLSFPDQAERGLSDLKHRSEVLPALSKASLHRRFVTVAHRNKSASEPTQATMDNNLRKLREKELAAGIPLKRAQQVIYKPASGLYSMWNDLGLQTALRGGDGTKRYRGLAPGFISPPVGNNEDDTNHSSPGYLKEIADSLIGRANSLLGMDGNVGVMEAVSGAIMATQALELLRCKTPTLSLTALSLKHEFESIAECQFLGNQVHFDILGRLHDLQKWIQSLGSWFGPNKRARSIATWNAELRIINRLIDIFRRFNQFDEEQVLQARARQLHRKLWFAKRPWLKPLEIVPWYVEKVLASFPLFLLAIVGWCVLSGILFVCTSKSVGWDQGMADAFATMFSLQPPGDPDLWSPSDGWNLPFTIILITVGLGFTHLGILISHIYSILTRK